MSYSTPHVYVSPNLTALPAEILTRIFVFAQSPAVAYVSRSLYTLSQSPSLRAHYLLYRYGRAGALSTEAFSLCGILTSDVIDILLTLDADPTVDDDYLLHRLVENNETDLAIRIIQGHPYNYKFESLFRTACRNNNVLFTKYLLENQTLSLLDGLYHTIRPSSYQVAEFLLKWGADPRACNNVALRTASLFGHTEISRLLIDAGADVSACNNIPLINACYHGHIELARLLIERGADVRAQSGMPLRLAVANGRTEVVRLLLEHGVRPKSVPYEAIRDASKRGFIDTVRLMLDSGIDPNIHKGEVLASAVLSKQLDIIKLLLERGADPNKGGLRMAVKGKDLHILKMLLDAGADLDDETMWKTVEGPRYAKVKDMIMKEKERRSKQKEDLTIQTKDTLHVKAVIDCEKVT